MEKWFSRPLASVCHVLAYFAQYNFCSTQCDLSIDMGLDMWCDKCGGHKSIGFGVSSFFTTFGSEKFKLVLLDSKARMHREFWPDLSLNPV
jgi:hypothetical protein